MKHTNNPKNRAAKEADRMGTHKAVSDTAAENKRKGDEKEKEQVSAYTFNRGYYSRNGGDKGYRGL